MKTIITTLLLSALIAALPGEPGDLCEFVNPDTGVPILCDIHAEGAPVYDGDVCCVGEICEPTKTPCADGTLYHCDLGEQDASGFTCYFEVPNYCDIFPCQPHEPGYQSPPMSFPMCCVNGVCWTAWGGTDDCELGDLYWCSDGVCNEDGTVTCFD